MEEKEYEKKQSYIIIPLSIIIIIIVIISTYKYYFEEIKDKKNDTFKSSLKKKGHLKLNNKSQGKNITVEIVGAVLNPGVYKLKQGSTRNDLIIMAGGLLKNAKTSLINRATKLKDGEKIIIPKIFDYDDYSKKKELITTEDVGYSKLRNGKSTKHLTNSRKSSKININTAPKELLITLPGIGTKTAENIIAYREKNKFQKIEDIIQIRRIGKKTFENIKDKICVR